MRPGSGPPACVVGNVRTSRSGGRPGPVLSGRVVGPDPACWVVKPEPIRSGPGPNLNAESRTRSCVIGKSGRLAGRSGEVRADPLARQLAWWEMSLGTAGSAVSVCQPTGCSPWISRAPGGPAGPRRDGRPSVPPSRPAAGYAAGSLSPSTYQTPKASAILFGGGAFGGSLTLCLMVMSSLGVL